jgi:hypothetical protein
MTRSGVLVTWSLVGVPVVFFSFVALAIAAVPHGQPLLHGWRGTFLLALFAFLLLSGVISMALSTRDYKSRWIVTPLYGIFMASALLIVSALIGYVYGDAA